ncbi:F-box domain containing protein [Tanacetum coccineum]
MELRVEEIMDSRLSSLPDDIIHKTLSTVSIQDVIKTSVLSSRWRYIWTSMPYLNFSSDEFLIWWLKSWFNSGDYNFGVNFAQFVKHIMSHRNNKVPVSSLKLNTNIDVSPSDIEKIMNYILSHSVQQMDVQCMSGNDWSHWCDDSDLMVTLLSSQSLKRLSLTTEHVDYGKFKYLTVSSTLGLPALTTLYLSCVEFYPDKNTLFSKCPNLKNLTLKSCKTKGLDSLSIRHQRLSNLTLEHERGSATVVNVVAPQLENLTIRYCFKEYHGDKLFNSPMTYYRDCLREYKHMISAPNLISLIYEGYDPLPLSTDGFHSLENVDLCICDISQEAAEALEIVRLFQQIQSVKFLTLNLEILELLSSYVQVISHHPPPFANLKSLDIYPLNVWESPEENVNISAEVKNYLLNSSQGATFTMVSRQEVVAYMNATQASVWMADLQTYLDIEKDIVETNWDHMQQPIDNGSIRGNRIVDNITSYLEDIVSVLTKLPASKRAMLQPCFSGLCAESNIFVSKMTGRIKIHGRENLNNASDCFHELATSLQSSS